MELADLTHATFAGRVGEKFAHPDAGIELVLASVADNGRGAGARPGGAFTLLFQGPGDPMLLQAIHHLTHDELDDLELFLVPVKRTEDGFEYEAVFN